MNKKFIITSFLASIILGIIFADNIISFIMGVIPEGIKVVTLNPAEGFLSTLSIIGLVSIVLMFPILIYSGVRYIKPALYNKEKKLLNNLLISCSFLFIMGTLLSFYAYVFYGLEWFSNFNIKHGYDTLWSLQSLITNISLLSLFSGIIFQTPLLLYYTTKKGIIDIELNQKNRVILLLILLLGIGLITPDGSMFSQLFLTVPIYGLVEGSIHFGNKYKEVKC